MGLKGGATFLTGVERGDVERYSLSSEKPLEPERVRDEVPGGNHNNEVTGKNQ